MSERKGVGQNLKTLTSDSVIYGLANAITKFAYVFLVPVYARLFTPAEYGIINLVNVSAFLISIVLVFALDNAASRWFYDTTDMNERKKAFATWFWFQVILSTISMLVFILLSKHISKTLLGSDTLRINIVIASVGLLFSILPNITTNWLRVQRKAKTTTIFSCSLGILTVLLSIAFVAFFKWGIPGALASVVVVNMIFSIVSAFILKDTISLKRFDTELLKKMLKFSGPLIPAAIAFWCITSSASYFLNFYTDKHMVGLYNMGVNIASGIAIFTGAFQQAWGPFAYSIIDKPEANATYANSAILYITLMSFLGLLVMLFAPELVMLIISPAYLPSSWVAGLLGFNVILIGLSYVATLGVTIMKSTSPFAIAVIIGAAFTLVLFILLIPQYNIIGTSIAVLIGQLFVTSYLFYRSQKVYPIPYKFTTIYMTFLTAILLGVCIRYLFSEISVINFILKSITVFIYLIILFYLNKTAILQIVRNFRPGSKGAI